MIKLTSISGSEFYLNEDLIFKIENLPDVVITLTDGKTIRVRDNIDEILQSIVEFKGRIHRVGAEASRN